MLYIDLSIQMLLSHKQMPYMYMFRALMIFGILRLLHSTKGVYMESRWTVYNFVEVDQ